MNDTPQSNVPVVVREFDKAMSNERMRADIRALLPQTIPFEQFRRVAQTALQTNPLLQNCTPKSVLAAVVRCAEAGLLPDGQEAAIVPFGGVATFMPMIYGLRKQVQQSGEVLWWKQRIVRQGDEFEHIDGDEERLVHRPGYDDDAPITHAYSIAKLTNGELHRVVMTIAQVESIRKRSRQATSGPWKNDYDEMVIKTVARRHFKSLPRAKDPTVAKRIQNTVSGFDEAVGLAEEQREEPVAIDHQQSARDRLSAAVAQFEDLPPENPAPRPRRRKTPQDRLNEANAGNAAAQQQPTDDSQSAPAASGAAIDGEFEDFPGDQPGEIEPSDAEQETAYRRGWNDRFAGRSRTAPLDIKHPVLRESFETGWDRADEAANSDAPPRTHRESEEQLNAIVGRVFA